MSATSLSLSPRMDLIRIALPKEFLPKEVEEKYKKLLYKNPNIITSPIDYLNESIQGVSFPGVSDINIEQTQHGSNSIIRTSKTINTEPAHQIVYTGPSNPLEKIEKEIKITFRLNQGLLNYFMIYETIFYKICKPLSYPPIDFLNIDILDEDGAIISTLKLIDVHIDGIEGLEFSFNKLERESNTFTATFRFNNIDYDFIDDELPTEMKNPVD